MSMKRFDSMGCNVRAHRPERSLPSAHNRCGNKRDYANNVETVHEAEQGCLRDQARVHAGSAAAFVAEACENPCCSK